MTILAILRSLAQDPDIVVDPCFATPSPDCQDKKDLRRLVVSSSIWTMIRDQKEAEKVISNDPPAIQHSESVGRTVAGDDTAVDSLPRT